MDAVDDGSVALVVTSPPYFAGKQYEEELEREGVPSSYLEYLEMLTEVFAECVRKLEPGGRIAVNVANLGRKPYRSLSADVIRILEHDLGLLLRGELIWQKGEGASGSCAWGSFRSAANPVLRDITERVIVASKGRFDRARTVKQRAAEGLPHESTLMTEDFMALTLDVWSIPPESARRVGHPAPFPVELPEQLIRLYTFEDDLVLDPFMGSGSALVAAARLGRRYVGYDLDPSYVEIARRRVARSLSPSVRSPVGRDPGRCPGDRRRRRREDFQSRATTRGQGGSEARRGGARGCRLHDRRNATSASARPGVTVNFVATDADGDDVVLRRVRRVHQPPRRSAAHRHGVEVARPGLRAQGTARGDVPLVFLTSHLPRRPSEGDTALRPPGPMRSSTQSRCCPQEGLERLAAVREGRLRRRPAAGLLDVAGSREELRECRGSSRAPSSATIPPEVFIAEDQDTLNWVLALRLIARTPGRELTRGFAMSSTGAPRGTVGRRGRAVDGNRPGGRRVLLVRPLHGSRRRARRHRSSSSLRSSRTERCPANSPR